MKEEIKKIKKELEEVYDRDQKVRLTWDKIEKEYGQNSLEIKKHLKEVVKVQKNNLKIVERIISNYGWLNKDLIGAKANYALWLVIQHSDKKTMLKYFNIIEKSFKEGEISTQDFVTFQDRLLLLEGKKQIYGTQYIYDKTTNKYVLEPIEDYSQVNKRRKEVGLPTIEEDLKHINKEE